uniref:Uncharacterized protein n=1 Tax=Oryza meridionalis TaxID=40149 RepID=A0A0E0EY86_9ORYZ
MAAPAAGDRGEEEKTGTNKHGLVPEDLGLLDILDDKHTQALPRTRHEFSSRRVPAPIGANPDDHLSISVGGAAALATRRRLIEEAKAWRRLPREIAGEKKSGMNKHGFPRVFRFVPDDLELLNILDDKLRGVPIDRADDAVDFHETRILDFHRPTSYRCPFFFSGDGLRAPGDCMRICGHLLLQHEEEEGGRGSLLRR